VQNKMLVHGLITAALLVVFIAGMEYAVPYDVPAPAVMTSAPVTHQQIAPTWHAAPEDCLPSGSGGACMPFSSLEKLMDEQPDTVPANPAAAGEETI
jgi:hypothetical protein